MEAKTKTIRFIRRGELVALDNVPPDRTLLELLREDNVGGSKAVGEPPLMLAIAARKAIRDAIAAFAPEARVQIPLASPATHEAIYTAIAQLRSAQAHG